MSPPVRMGGIASSWWLSLHFLSIYELKACPLRNFLAEFPDCVVDCFLGDSPLFFWHRLVPLDLSPGLRRGALTHWEIRERGTCGL